MGEGSSTGQRQSWVVGAVALAVAVILVAAALVLRSGSSDDIPAGQEWQQQAGDFPITAGMPATNADDGSAVVAQQASGVPELSWCGDTAWSAAGDTVVDVLGAAYRGESEDTLGRTLALYVDDTAASQAVRDLKAAVEACPLDESGAPRAPQAYAMADAQAAGEESFAFSQASLDEAGNPLGDLWVYQVVRSGNAVYLAAHYGQGGADASAVQRDLAWLARSSALATEALCRYSADPCAG